MFATTTQILKLQAEIIEYLFSISNDYWRILGNCNIFIKLLVTFIFFSLFEFLNIFLLKLMKIVFFYFSNLFIILNITFQACFPFPH